MSSRAPRRVKTDIPLKMLFQYRAEDLLVLTGDDGATCESASAVEVQAQHARADMVLKLTRAGETYYRHVEFQGKNDPDMAERCFRYNTRLVLKYRAPVLTTVFYLFPPGPRGELVFRLTLGGREVNVWRFDRLRLWELEPQAALDAPGPGMAALVPLMRGGDEPQLIRRAARHIEATAPADQQAELLDILSVLAGRRYTLEELTRIVGRRPMIESSVWRAAVAEGEAKGRAEGEAKGRAEGEAKGRVEGEAKGRVEGEIGEDRLLCLEMIRQYHPAVLDTVRHRIRACHDAARLRSWILHGPRMSDDEIVRVISAPQ